MKLRRTVMAVIALVFCITSIAGCSQKKLQEERKEHAMGRYVEETIEMPELVRNEKEIIYKMLKNPKGLIEIYGIKFTENNDYSKSKQFKYILENGEWSKEFPGWMNHTEMVDKIVYGEDNFLYYGTYENKKEKMYWKFFRKNEDGSKEEIIIKGNKEIKDDYSNMPYEVKVRKNNRIIISYREKCVLYENGEKVYEMENGGKSIGVGGNQILLNNSNNTGCALYDMDQRTKIKEIPFNQNIENAVYESDADGNWYMALDSGIHRLSQNGTVWETIADGSLNSLGSPTYGVNSMIKGSDNDYYIMLESGEGKREIKHYVYKDDVASVPEKTLSVVSMEENLMVRQVMTQFQNDNQDVKVDYKVLLGEDGMTQSDAVKLLNTELIAGKGADIIILDDLPISAYIEKDVLMDLSDILKPLLEKNELLPNIVESCRTNNKIYMIPGQIGIPVLFGKKEAVEAGKKSLSEFAEYAASEAKKPILGSKIYGNIDLLEDLTIYYGTEFADNSKKMDTEALVGFLGNVKKISSQTMTVEGSFLTEDMTRYALMSSSLIANDYAECGIAELKDMIDIYAPFESIKRIGGSYSNIGSIYIPHSMIGINNASKEKELASIFLQIMMSEQMGASFTDNGFTINQKALEMLITKPNDFYMKIDDFEATRPENQKIEEFVQLCKEVNVMSQVDSFLLEMIKNEADSFLSGKKTAKETAVQITEKSKAYRAEKK